MTGPRLYTLFGILMLMLLGWLQYVGFAFTDFDRVRDVPRSVRNNPGSYRSHYTWQYHHTGGK